MIRKLWSWLDAKLNEQHVANDSQMTFSSWLATMDQNFLFRTNVTISSTSLIDKTSPMRRKRHNFADPILLHNRFEDEIENVVSLAKNLFSFEHWRFVSVFTQVCHISIIIIIKKMNWFELQNQGETNWILCTHHVRWLLYVSRIFPSTRSSNKKKHLTSSEENKKKTRRQTLKKDFFFSLSSLIELNEEILLG